VKYVLVVFLVLISSVSYAANQWKGVTSAKGLCTACTSSPPAWKDHPAMIAWWPFDDTGPPYVNMATASPCGSDCDLSQTGTIDEGGTDTAYLRQGTSYIQGQSGDMASCEIGTCQSLDRNFQSLAMGCWFDSDTALFGFNMMMGVRDVELDTRTYELATNNITNVRGVGCDGSGMPNLGVSGLSDTAVNSDFYVCSWEYENSLTRASYFNWNLNDSQTASSAGAINLKTSHGGLLNGPTADGVFFVFTDFTPINYGRADSCWVFDGYLDNDEACFLCSCGVDGVSGGCVCNGDTFANTGRNTTRCDSCTLPSSCQNAWPKHWNKLQWGDNNHDGALKLGCVGDSNTDDNFFPLSYGSVKACEHMKNNYVWDSRFAIANYGVSATTACSSAANHMDSQITSAIADGMDAVLIAFGTNDMKTVTCTSPQDTVNCLLAGYRRLEAVGITAYVATVPPRYDSGECNAGDNAAANVIIRNTFPSNRIVDFDTDFPSTLFASDGLHTEYDGNRRRGARTYSAMTAAN